MTEGPDFSFFVHRGISHSCELEFRVAPRHFS